MFGVSLGIIDSGGAGGGGGSFESIATATASGSSATVTFNSIAADWKHLQIRLNAKDTGVGSYLYLNFNNDFSGNYAYHSLNGNGSTASASGSATQAEIRFVGFVPAASATNIYGVGIIDVIDYASTTKNKTVRTMAGNDRNGSGEIRLSSGLWQSTAAVTRIDISEVNGDPLTAGSVFSLYGIKG